MEVKPFKEAVPPGTATTAMSHNTSINMTFQIMLELRSENPIDYLKSMKS